MAPPPAGLGDVIAPNQDGPIRLKPLLPDELGGELLNRLAMPGERGEGVRVIGPKMLPQGLIGDGTLDPLAVDEGGKAYHIAPAIVGLLRREVD